VILRRHTRDRHHRGLTAPETTVAGVQEAVDQFLDEEEESREEIAEALAVGTNLVLQLATLA
jgi:hypothetical protein